MYDGRGTVTNARRRYIVPARSSVEVGLIAKLWTPVGAYRLGGGCPPPVAGEYRFARKMFPNSFTKVTTCVQPHNQTDQ